jgi:tetratricopeptide (TPR) repeat protein
MMQPGQAGRQQAQQAAIQGELQAQQARYQHQRYQQRRRKRQARQPAPAGPEAQRRASSSSGPPQASGRTHLGGWVIAAVSVFWAIAIATHIEWVRLHDGPVRPLSYALAAAISALAAAFLLALYLLRRRPGAARNVDAVSAAGRPAGAAGVPRWPDSEKPRPSAATTGSGGSPALLVMSGPTQQRRRIPIPPGGLALGRNDQLGAPFSADDLISREHALIRRCPDGSVEVTDLGSTNGTYLNSSRLTVATRMATDDVLRIGQVEMRLDVARPWAPSNGDTIAGPSGQDDTIACPAGPASVDLLSEARDLYEQHRYEESRRRFLKMADVPGAGAEAQYGLAMIALSLGDPVVAEDHLQRAVTIDPDHANALYELGALAEQAHQITDAVGYYRRAVQVAPRHVSALAALSRLDSQGGGPGPVAPASAWPAASGPGQAGPSAPSASWSADGLPSVYQFLLEDLTPISQQTVKLIQRVECEARPRYVAYVGRYFARTIGTTAILAVALVVINVVVSLVRDHSPSSVPAAATVSRISIGLGVCIALLPLCVAVIGYVCVSCTFIRIQKARLQIEKGVFRKHLNNIDFWRVHNIDVDRRLINRLTDDGTLVFSLTFGVLPENYQRRRRKAGPDHVVEVCGIARGAELAELHQDLLNLTFLLRGNPIVKGIIQ